MRRGAWLLLSTVLAGHAQAAAPPALVTPAIERIDEIRAALKSLPAPIEDQAPTRRTLAQWLNWPNWPNWPNWNNWGNWGNWGNWANF